MRGGTRPALAIVFLTVFLDLIGFGIVLPLLPFYATSMGASPFDVGVIIASYSAMQFLFSPIWGALSDQYGRRPLLILGLLGSAASYVVFGLAETLGVLLFSRVVAGIMGATIPVAQAFIADSTTLERRARGMGLIGAAFGLGFIVGPAMGGVLSRWGFALPGFVAAFLSLASAIGAWWFLPESLPPELRDAPGGLRDGLAAVGGRLRSLHRVFGRARLRSPMLSFFLGTIGFAAFTTVFPLFLEDPLGLEALQAGGMFALVAVISAAVQGGLIGPLVERLGERRVAAVGGGVIAGGLGLLGASSSTLTAVLSLVPVGLGWGLLAPSLQGLISRRARPEEQGEVLGVNQSLSSAGRVIGPLGSGWVFGAAGHRAAFGAAALLLAACALWVAALPSRDVPPSPA